MPSRRKVTPTVVVLIALLVVCLAGGIAGGMYLTSTFSQIRDAENSHTIEPALPAEDVGSATQNAPVDFAALQKQNSDIYAWIFIPGTDVNFPVCQNAEDGAYYLTHDANGKESQLGAIFSEAQFNNRDFQDSVSVLYGHNGFGNTMFTALHQYESGDFLDAHDKFYLYVPGHIYTYQVFSAFMSDGNHLMGAFNFQTETGFAQFAQFAQNPNAVGAVTRPAQIDANSKLVVLSTCNSGALESVGRYLVCGVMVHDQPTK